MCMVCPRRETAEERGVSGHPGTTLKTTASSGNGKRRAAPEKSPGGGHECRHLKDSKGQGVARASQREGQGLMSSQSNTGGAGSGRPKQHVAPVVFGTEVW